MRNSPKSTDGGNHTTKPKCSFCGKYETDPMVEGPRKIFICDKCIDICKSVLEAEKRKLAGLTTANRQFYPVNQRLSTTGFTTGAELTDSCCTTARSKRFQTRSTRITFLTT